MKIRTISGAVFVAIITGFFLLRQFVDYRLFQLLTAFLCVVGTFEMARAIKEHLFKGFRTLALIFSVAILVIYGVAKYVFNFELSFVLVLLAMLVMIIVSVILGIIKNASVAKIVVNVSPFLYPSLAILALLMLNDLQNIGGGVEDGFFPLLLTIVIACACDTLAYLVGMTYNKIRKGNAKKLCPNLSPKKTIAGAIGGLIGGAVGALLLYLIFKPDFNLKYPMLVISLIGFFASIFNQAGDLFESFIKRKVGIKDMGKIMPGHGGVLDRIDGLGFVAIVLVITFMVI